MTSPSSSAIGETVSETSSCRPVLADPLGLVVVDPLPGEDAIEDLALLAGRWTGIRIEIGCPIASSAL